MRLPAFLLQRDKRSPALTCCLVRGDMFLKAGKVKEARSDFMAAENLKQGSGLYGLAGCAAADGDARAAVSYMEAHLKSQYRKSEPEIMLDKSFRSVASSPEWKASGKKSGTRDTRGKSWEIDYYMKSGQTDLAGEVWGELSARLSGYAGNGILPMHASS